MVILIKNTFGIKFDRSEGKDKNGKENMTKELTIAAIRQKNRAENKARMFLLLSVK